ncbi:hypothetical protein AB0395_32735 [Streptosporangium sp. NPDC051023]|uniref:hypothetical protein n=1 Tax=Streptosporangium sp. NPDC051023 TaxID=3155410 RepID=UPI00344B0E8E
MSKQSPVESALWGGALAIIAGLPKETSNTTRTVAEFTEDSSGTNTVRTSYEVEQLDGSNKVYALALTVQESTDDRDSFWGPGSAVDKADPERRVVVDGEHYLIGDGADSFRGFGGRRHDIEFFDGRTVTTRDLWHQGTVPPKWRERYPDNAKWAVKAEQSSPTPGGEE